MYLAIGVEPTKLTAFTSGLSSSVSTATLSPCTTFSTPSGRPASRKRSARKTEALGSRSLGFSTTVLPQAIALAIIQSGTITGKLKGVIAATTPTGCLIECTSMPVETCSSRSPFKRCSKPEANSTFSRPRATSPAASESTLPCSLVTIAASSGVRCLSSWRRLKKTSARLVRLVLRHAGSAACAAAMACSTVATEAIPSSCCTSPVAGL